MHNVNVAMRLPVLWDVDFQVVFVISRQPASPARRSLKSIFYQTQLPAQSVATRRYCPIPASKRLASLAMQQWRRGF